MGPLKAMNFPGMIQEKSPFSSFAIDVKVGNEKVWKLK